VHSITNYVVMNSTANVLLAAGAAPVMAHAREEMKEMVGLASALVLNIGTLSEHWVESMFAAGGAAGEKGIPIVLDPVGAGATRFRTRTALRLLKDLSITVLRGNASEIRACAGAAGRTRGVDSTADSQEARDVAVELAHKSGIVVAMTGEVDIVTDGRRTVSIRNGHPLMSRVTGTGCASSVLTAAFCGANTDSLAATASSLAFFGLAGERAAPKADGPGTFWPLLLDQCHNMTPEELTEGARVELEPRL
jgi:hydroxyethylthiazole kinase